VSDELAIVEVASDIDLEAALAVRHEVFCVEQRIAKAEEFDGRDGDCRHYLARWAGRAIGAARTCPLDGEETKIQRVAVLAPWRRRGIGRALMERAVSDLARTGVARIALTAQCHAESFYADLGFVTEGGVFDEVGVPHVRMVLRTGQIPAIDAGNQE